MEQGRLSDIDADGAATGPSAGGRQLRARDRSALSADALLEAFVQLLARRVAHDLIISEDAKELK
ncbi:hypothetical protein [Sphingomonas olei]|jgi:hypothetical protein|uniref:Uncharacterized protein n=1 Tax=Sphingomonas olei TaxID=1886787 RepID=A0ABY2QD14_9SPHN|nr:hypothetical protein [Sphingomonas olei]THG36804.1 hypothetical protein E5988_16515 [Sphingomonas olei]